MRDEYICISRKTNTFYMKKLIVLFSVLWISATVSAQSEIKNDSLTLSMGQNKMFGDFILDGSLFTMAVKQMPSFADLLKTAPSMDGLLQSINQPARWVFGKASADGRPTLLYTNRSILLSSMVRIINTLSLFGFAVIMPMMFVDELGFTTSEWLQVWAVFFFTTIFSNVFWGVVAEKMGWMRVVRWFGCIGMALSSLAFYYIPQHFGHNFAMALVPAIALGIFVAAFVPMAAVFPALEPRHKGAAISVYNLSAGLSNFLAPAIAVVLLPWFSTLGVVIAYTALYVVAFILCPFIRVEQPGFVRQETCKGETVGIS